MFFKENCCDRPYNETIKKSNDGYKCTDPEKNTGIHAKLLSCLLVICTWKCHRHTSSNDDDNDNHVSDLLKANVYHIKLIFNFDFNKYGFQKKTKKGRRKPKNKKKQYTHSPLNPSHAPNDDQMMFLPFFVYAKRPSHHDHPYRIENHHLVRHHNLSQHWLWLYYYSVVLFWSMPVVKAAAAVDVAVVVVVAVGADEPLKLQLLQPALRLIQ